MTKPVFFDPSGRRARHLSRFAVVLIVVALLLTIGFIASLFVAPRMQALVLGGRDAHRHALKGVKLADPALLKPAEKLAAEVRAHQQGVPRARHFRRVHVGPDRALPIAMSKTPGRPVTVGFYVNWDDNSYPALKRALPHLDWVVPSWLSLRGNDMQLHVDIDARALDLIHRQKPTTPILPLLQNAVDGNWEGPQLAKLLADPTARHARIAQIVDVIGRNHFQGVTVDFEEVPSAAQAHMKQFLRELAAAFAPHGWGIVLAVPFDDDNWDYAGDARIVDFLLLMAYDQHWADSDPGSIAGETWFENTLDKRMKDLDPDRTIVALGSYGYDWAVGSHKSASAVTFQEAMLTARDSDASIVFDGDSANPHFAYDEDNGQHHEVWFLDGVTAFNEVHAADGYQPYGYAVWRLGSEDPSIWSVLGRPYDAKAPQALDHIAMGEDIDIEGRGEVLHIDATPTPGARTFHLDPGADGGDIDDETYTALPAAYVIRRYGENGKAIALTFDDGPDPEWTPKILDILRDKHVPATFFVIGENAEASPRLIQREVLQGDEVGNHTFTHPNLGETPASLVTLELNATQRLVEALTGRSMRLFRAPYFGDAEPTTADEIVPIQQAQAMGYIAVGLHVDPDDWERPPADLIVQRVIAGVNNPDPNRRGQIVLLHDGGGNRSQTVLALPRIIDELRAQGYHFVPVSTLAGLTRDQAMPPIAGGSLARMADRPVFFTLGWSGHALHWLFTAAIWLGLARLVLLGGLALVNRRRERRRMVPPDTDALISVLIPAHNEAKVIDHSLQRILRSDHPELEVIVVDDGSTDDTATVVGARAAADSRVQLIRVPNGGKARAINAGLERARGEVVVVMDADTQFEPSTIGRLARWFADPRVGAVAGNAKVGNRINLITAWQALEYVTAQNLERRALATLDAITVVPGAVGAWRREALLQLGGFPVDTLAEDQDLTLAVQKAGYRVLFDSEAVAWTEAPDSFRGLARQRFRWSFGTLQCLWKHRDAMLRPRYRALGLVAMPQVWLFQIIFAVLSPLVDLALVWQLGASALDWWQHRGHYDPHNLYKVLVFYAVFMAVDLAAAALAFLMERGERWRLMAWMPLQRFGYRQLMYYVVVRSVSAALRGPSVGWGKLERKATVSTGS